MRQMEDVSLSLFLCMKHVFLPWCLIFLLSLSLFLHFPIFDSSGPNNSLISFPLMQFITVFPSCVGKQALSHSKPLVVARWGALMKVIGPLRAHGCFHCAHIHLIPSSLPLSPQTGLIEGSVMTPCLTLSDQVNLTCSHSGSLQLDANELRHYEMNENFLF